MNIEKELQDGDAVITAIKNISHWLQTVIVQCAGFACGLYLLARGFWRGSLIAVKKAKVKKGDV